MVIEPRRLRAAAVLVLAPTGDGDDADRLAPFLAANLAANLVTVELGHPEVEHGDIGRKLSAAATAALPS